MGLTPLHGQLTVSVLTDMGFSNRVAQIAAEANEAVDAAENQGSAARVTNLHAMRGFTDGNAQGGRRMQTSQQAQDAVDALLSAAQQAIVEAIRNGQSDREAAKQLGAALHTVQDREYHHFEPWPFESVADSILNAWKGDAYGLPRHYMLRAHVPRDLGYVHGLLNLSVTALDYSAGYTTGGGWSATGRLEATQVSTNPFVPHLSLGIAGQANGPHGNEWIGYGLLTWGRIPSRPDAGVVPPKVNNGSLTIQRPPALAPESSEGANSLIAARSATTDYVNEISRLVPPADWERFKG